MIIYKITNFVNQKSYIGQTKHKLQTRKSQHLYESNNGNEFILYKAIRKYGWKNFTWEVLCECETKEELNEMEFHYIKQYKSHMSENGYNMTLGFDSIYEITDITRERMRQSKLGKKNPWYGKKRPEMSKIHKGDNNAMRRPEIRKKFLKQYIVTNPDGTVFIVDDLPLFCKKNDLKINTMYCAAHGKYKTKNGWTCLKK